MTFTEEQKQIMDAAIDKYGYDHQIDLAIEEMSELTKALLKHRRIYQGRVQRGTYTIEELEDSLGDIAEEMADVAIMLEQLEMIFGDGYKAKAEKKLKRLKERL